MTVNSHHQSRRFLGAANTLLRAMKSHTGMNSLIPVGVNAVSSARRYTLNELVDAMSMLIRLDLVPDQRTRGTGQRREQAAQSSHSNRPDRPFVETYPHTRTTNTRSATLN